MGALYSSTMKTVSNLLYPCKEQLPQSINFSKLSDKAMAPSRASYGAAGYDLYSANDMTVPAQGKALVQTDIALALPEGWYGRVAPRLVHIKGFL